MNAYQALLETAGPCVLFESTTTGGPLARSSFLVRVAEGLRLALETALES